MKRRGAFAKDCTRVCAMAGWLSSGTPAPDCLGAPRVRGQYYVIDAHVDSLCSPAFGSRDWRRPSRCLCLYHQPGQLFFPVSLYLLTGSFARVAVLS